MIFFKYVLNFSLVWLHILKHMNYCKNTYGYEILTLLVELYLFLIANAPLSLAEPIM